ncbi:MAG: gluconeogenesis factor YvcK family protein [Patescibacteria group bacterium]
MKHIVTVGGGTGSYTVLFGLKHLSRVSLTALVSMADDGGSTGVLRDELGVLPGGDVRQCLVALSEHSDIVRELINYRFSGGTLKGHSFGNIFLAALEKVTGDFVKGVEVASEILKVKGVVIPVTNNKAKLSMLLKNGTLIEGENKINHLDIQDVGIKRIFYKKDVQLNENAKRAILEADYIILGPGNYYCSLVPNLIVSGFKEAIGESKAQIILPINLTNKQGHTKHWKASNYVKDMELYLGKAVDIILVNNEAPSKKQIEHYKLQEGDGVLVEDDLKDKRVIREALLSHSFVAHSKADNLRDTRSFIRHDSEKLANCIKKIIASPVDGLRPKEN